MDLVSQTIRLVRDAIFARDMETEGSFIFNMASEKLENIGVSTLPEIEYIILHEVMPFVDSNLDYVPKPFLGIASVLVTYFRLCKKNHTQNAVLFLKALQGILRIEALRAIGVVYFSQRPSGGIPELLLNVIKEFTVIGSEAEKQVANWLIYRQQDKDKEPNDFREGLFKALSREIKPNS